MAQSAAEEEGRHLSWLLAAAGIVEPERRASALLREFGSMAAFLGSSRSRKSRALGGADSLRQVDGFAAAVRHLLRPPRMERAKLSNWRDLSDYLRIDMGFDATERLKLLHLDGRCGLILEECIAAGGVESIPVSVRQIVTRCLEVGSSSVVVVHNHPSGDTSPSPDDLSFTSRLQVAAIAVGVDLLDHFIIGRSGAFSFHRAGLLRTPQGEGA